ncbi:MAG TPA: glycosyltransferase [Polyangiaceae bacterium]|nr:glycosyltransferase [Polyangiaceae bacterium]
MTEPKRISFVTWDGGGNVPPELALARRLVARGHSVRVLGDPTLEDEARAAGCEFSPWTTAPHKRGRDRSHDVFKDYEIQSPLKMIDAYMQKFLAEPAPRWAADTRAELEAHPADLVVVDFAIPAALIATERLKLPAVTLMPNIWMIPTPGIPPLGPGFMPARTWLGRARDALLRGLMQRIFQKALPALNGARQAQGLAPLADVYEQLLAADQILVQTSPVFDFTSPHQPDNVRYVGPELDDPTWTAQSARWSPPFAEDDRRPLVLVGLSSTFQNQVEVLRRLVLALSRLPVRAVLTLGPALDPSEVPGSDNVVVLRSAPHSQVLEHAALLITHCGHGTTLKGLAAGVPLVCLPMGRDQNDTAARVVHAGAGVRLMPSASAQRIEAAVRGVLAEPRYREAAARLQQALLAREGCVDPIAALEQLAAARGGEAAPARVALAG